MISELKAMAEENRRLKRTQPKMLNGESDGHQMVFVIGFDSMDVLDSWHSSPEYQALIPLREEGSDQHMVAYEGMGLPG